MSSQKIWRQINYRLPLSIVMPPTLLDRASSTSQNQGKLLFRWEFFFFRKFTKFYLVLHFCHGSLGRRQGAFPLLVKYFPHFENWPFVGWAAGLEQTGGGWWAVMPDGSYQADIMEDVAIWTRTNFSCSNQPTHTWICKKQLCDIKSPTYLMWKILPY